VSPFLDVRKASNFFRTDPFRNHEIHHSLSRLTLTLDHSLLNRNSQFSSRLRNILLYPLHFYSNAASHFHTHTHSHANQSRPILYESISYLAFFSRPFRLSLSPFFFFTFPPSPSFFFNSILFLPRSFFHELFSSSNRYFLSLSPELNSQYS